MASMLALATLAAAAPTPLIIDTDMGFDVDDVGAVCAAHALEQMGEAKLLAIVHDTGYSKGVGAVAAINSFFGRKDLPLGAWKGEFGRDGDKNQNKYVSDLISHGDANVTDSSQVLDCASLYRQVLVAQPDASVHIAAIGMPTCLAALLSSGPDDFSSLRGRDLVSQKVQEIVWMDGPYNFGCAMAGSLAWLGPDQDCHGSAQRAVMSVPDNVRQVFSKVGWTVFSGSRLSSCASEASPCRRAYQEWCGGSKLGCIWKARPSWDPLALVLAVRGAEAAKLSLKCGGRMSVDEKGHETMVWGNGTSCTVSKNAPNHELTGMLDDLYCKAAAPPATVV